MGLELHSFIPVGSSSGGGGPAENKFVWNENHTSEIDGIKQNFNTTNPFVTGFTKVKYNGVELILNVDYTEFGNNEIRLVFIPEIPDILIFDYLKI